MSAQIGQNPHRLDLYFLVLSCKDVQFDAVEDGDAYFVVQNLFSRHIVEQNICDARYSIEDELFMLVDRPFVNCADKAHYEVLNSTSLELCHRILLLRAQVS